MVTAVVIPVKDLTSAKQRLSAALSVEQRRSLATAMLEDVLAAVTEAPVDLLWVVGKDEEVIALATRHGATVIAEKANRGHSQAVALAQTRAISEGVDAFLTIPADVPLVTGEEIGRLLDFSPRAPGAVFVPSRSGRAHRVKARVLRLPGLGLDVDAPEDLEELARLGGDSRSARLARSFAEVSPGTWA
jgi:2-phospho-L-lactate guanylyltransferase